MKSCLTCWMMLLAVASVAASGCASWKPLATSPSVSQQRVQRSGEVVREFEQQRTKAQIDAALDRWQQGDIAGCESRLRSLLARDPQNIEARLRLAELAWSCDDVETSAAEYRQALAQAPDRGEIREALELVMAAQPATH